MRRYCWTVEVTKFGVSIIRERAALINNLEVNIMGVLDGLLKKAEGNPVDVSSDSALSAESSTQEILDYVMVRLCELMDVREVAFKGGYMLSQMLPKNESRATTDIDFSIYRKEYYKVVKDALCTIGDELVSFNICSEYKVKEDVQPTMSGGIDFYKSDGSKALGVDVGLHDLSWGIERVEVQGKGIIAFTPERMLSDKISAMFTRKRFRRSKDLYDLYVISNNHDIDMETLRLYISNRGELDYGLSPIRDEIMDGYRHAYDMLQIDRGVQKTIEYRQKPGFDTVIQRLKIFVDNLDSNVVWDHVERVMKNAMD